MLTGCGTSDTNLSVESAQKASSTSSVSSTFTTENKGTLDGKYDVEIETGIVQKDLEDKDVIAIKFKFTNNDDKTIQPLVALSDAAFQNGVELNKSYMIIENDRKLVDNQYKEIKKGGTVEVIQYYILDDASVPVTFELKPSISFLSNKAEKIFTIT